MSADVGVAGAQTAPPPLSARTREDLIRRSWMATDGLWFYETAKARGLDEANATNSAVVRAFGRQEMRRLMRACDISSVQTVAQYRHLFQLAVDLYLGSMFEVAVAHEGDTDRLDVTMCFAYLGVKRAGIEKEYRCGPGERLTGWLEAMDLAPDIQPRVGLCQMAHTGSCTYFVKVALPLES